MCVFLASLSCKHLGKQFLFFLVSFAVLACVFTAQSSAQTPDETSFGEAGSEPARPSLARPESRRSLNEASTPQFAFALSFKASTLGFGSDASFRLQKHINVRFGFTGFTYRRDVLDGDISYKAAFRLRSLQTLLDWFPFERGFHISPGFLLYDGNRVSAHAIIPTGRVMTAGAEAFVSDIKDPIIGTATSKLRSAAPMLLVGYGNLVPHSRRFGLSIDGGVVFQGSPSAQIALTGSACAVNLTHCHSIATDPNIQADITSGRQTMESDLSILRFYPVVSFSTSYRF
jgi:hypothetical protein